MEYLVLYDEDCYVIVDAINIKDCLIQLSVYMGCNSYLFTIALNGCKEEDFKTMVKMFEFFSGTLIDGIFQLGEKIYESEKRK